MRRDLTSSEMIVIINELNVAAYAGEWQKIDEWLSADVEKMVVGEMVTYMRTTVPMRSKLTRWVDFVSRCYNELVLRGEDADRICVGLTKFIKPNAS